MTQGSITKDAASFKDPSGFVYTRDGVLLRQVEPAYRPHYDHLRKSGLFTALVRDGLLVDHEEVGLEKAQSSGAYKVLRPRVLPLISYPYEWSFGQLKAAALLTLKVQAIALEHDMVLKDASAYNVQFDGASPILIDSLSFEQYLDGVPWVAYRQFCQHFLAPLALMAAVDVRLGQLLRVHIDGVPLDLASRLLPRSSWLKPSIVMHVHAHARLQQRYADTTARKADASSKVQVSRTRLRGLVSSLQRTIEKLMWRATGTEWADYYADFKYTDSAFARKRELVSGWYETLAPPPRRVLDLGANTGAFSWLLADKGASVIAADMDPAAVERNHQRCVDERRANVLPLLIDLLNPSPGIGWANSERPAFLDRASADLVLCLALIHHLAIGNNVPFEKIAALLRQMAPWLIVEFVPKQDEQTQRLLAGRRDVFPDYTTEAFEAACGRYFTIERREPIIDSQRILYLMRGRPARSLVDA